MALLGLAVGLAVAEGLFYRRDDGAFPHLNVYTPDDKLGVALAPGAMQRTRVLPNPASDVRINAVGLRGGPLPAPSPESVLVVGDSQVFGLGVNEDQTFSARLEGLLSGRRVINAGVPTYGPIEYNAMAEVWLEKTGAKTLVYVINVANDLFEAARPNTERHKVWDGWAVRAPTAPLSVTAFPGRSWLFRESHLVFALRGVLYRASHPELDDAAFETDGTWRDLVAEATAQAERRAAMDRERELRARTYETEVTYAERLFKIAEDRMIKALYDEFTQNDGEKAVLIGLATATPGDIVAPAPWEEAPTVKASVLQIRQGATFRLELEKKLRELAASKPAVKEVVEAYDAADRRKLEAAAYALKVARRSGPIVKRIEEAKAIADKAGAALLVAVLPIDVEVSPDEWKKYGAAPIDISALKVVHDDIVESAIEMGARAVDLTEALRAAEPGAFLDRDLHMTPKGHEAAAAAIAKALAAPPASITKEPTLPLGRSFLPTEVEFGHYKEMAVTGSSAAGCETKKVREWLRLRCKQRGVIGPKPLGARILEGGHGDERISLCDGVLTVLVPVVPGDTLSAELRWEGESRALRIEWPEKEMPIWRDGQHISSATKTPIGTAVVPAACKDASLPASAPAPVSAPASAPVSADLEAAAKAYLDAAKKHAETCMCRSDPFEGLIRDVCKITGAEVDALQAARARVDALLSPGSPVDPTAGAFLREAQLHAIWVAEKAAYFKSTPIKIADDTRLLRGGVYAYQRLARLWNDWHPKEPVSGIAYQSYWPGGVSSAEHPLWVAIQYAEYYTNGPASAPAGAKGKPMYLPWIECVDGPCLVGY